MRLLARKPKSLIFCLFLIICTREMVAECGSIDRVPLSGGYVKNCSASKVIVFVHGLFSNPEVWRNEVNHAYWPKMIADDPDSVFADTDVYVAGYDTPSVGGRMTMADLEAEISNRLDRDNVFSRHKEVVFVAHSMGGLLTQQILLTYRDRSYYQKVHTIFLYATPQEGSRVANLAKFFNPDPKLKELQAGSDNFILPDIDLRWSHADFSKIERYCAYETRREKGFTVVDRNSATRGCQDTVPLDADHHHAVEPLDLNADAYTFLKNKLKSVSGKSEVTNPSQGSQPTHVQLGMPFGHEGPYLELDRTAKQLLDIQNTFNRGALSVAQNFVSPYKHGMAQGPIPTRYPDDVLDLLIQMDVNEVTAYINMEPTISKIRQEALDCLRFTPNDANKDKSEFMQADLTARKLTSVAVLSRPGISNVGTLGGMVGYLQALQQRVGDYHCSSQPQAYP